jgi:hypothetical protein
LKLEQEEIVPLRQYVDVFVQPTHFVDVHEDKRHDVKCQHAEKMNLIFDTHHPNQSERQEYFGQKDAQQDFGNLETAEKLQICDAKDKSK